MAGYYIKYPSASQGRGLFACLAGTILFLGCRLWQNPTTLPDPLPIQALAARDDVSRVDPNTATLEELAAIPRLGSKRAAAIIQYRTDFLAKHPGSIAFEKLDDLRGVTGIGQATAENMAPYLSLSKSGEDNIERK